MSANDTGNNEIIPRIVHICITVEENLEKPQEDECLMGAVRPVIASYRVPFLRMRSVESHSSLGRGKDGRA